MTRITNFIIIAALAALIFLFYFQGLGKLGLEFHPDENFYYQASRQMLETEDFITPYYFDNPRFEKPILYYWLVAASIKFFGLSWSAARGVSLLFSVLFLILLYDFCLSFYDRKTALTAVLISATFLCFFRYPRMLIPESTFLFFLFAFLSLFIKGILKPGNKILFALAYSSLGLAFLLKGPVALVIAFVTLFLYFRTVKIPLKRQDIFLIEGLLIVCVIALPWFIRMIQLHGGDYLKHIFFREMKDRVFFITGAGVLKDLRRFLKGLLYFIPVIFYFYLPWSIFMPWALRGEFIKIKEKRDDGGLLLFAYLIAIFAFFSLINEKHRHYMFYMTPALAVFIARFLLERFNIMAFKAAFAALFTVSILAMYFLGITVSRHAYTLDDMFKENRYDFRKDDLIAVGSRDIHPYLLEANVNRPVPKMCIDMGDKFDSFHETWNLMNNELFYPYPGRAFCLLTLEDRSKFLFMPEIEKDIRTVGSAYIPRNKMDIRGIWTSIVKRDKDLFWDSFRHEAVFITNKPEVQK